MTAHHARRLAHEHTSSIILEHYADCPRRAHTYDISMCPGHYCARRPVLLEYFADCSRHAHTHTYLCVQGIVHGDLSSWNILLASATEEEEEESDNIGFVAKVGPCCCGVR